MKKVLLFSALCVFLLNTAHSQERRVFTFNMSGDQMQMNTGTPVKQKPVDKATVEFVYDYRYPVDTGDLSRSKTDMMVLQIGSGISKFSSIVRRRIDSLISVSSLEEIQANPMRYVGGVPFSVFKNYPEGKLTVTDKISSDWFSYEEEIPVQDWQLKDSVKQILGYSCRSAECEFRGRRFIAWYSDEIAIDAGPWKFGGLPGLIMEIADSQGHYSFTLVGIYPKVSNDITVPDVQFNKTSRSKYYATKHKFDTNPIAYMTEISGVKMTVTNPDGSPNTKAMQAKTLKFDYIERDYKNK